MFGKLRKILGATADVFIFMRSKGWCQKKIDPFKKKPKRGF